MQKRVKVRVTNSVHGYQLFLEAMSRYLGAVRVKVIAGDKGDSMFFVFPNISLYHVRYMINYVRMNDSDCVCELVGFVAEPDQCVCSRPVCC